MEGSWESILIRHAYRYPIWQAHDVYKLIHQAVMGSEHAIPGEAAARAWLARELREMGPGPDEPLIDPISPDGRIVRVHLRPYAAAGLAPDVLLQAFLWTAREVRGSVPAMERGLDAARRAAAGGALGPDARTIHELVGDAARDGFPALHHSAAFAAVYRPAYRVAARDSLPHVAALRAASDPRRVR